MSEASELRILLCLPFGKDNELACSVLERAGLACFICKSVPELILELDKGGGAVLSAEEALPTGACATIRDYLARQPTWSDLPILVLTKPGGESPWIRGASESLGNVTLLERPVRASTLISAARSALRARRRQYEIRTADQRKDEFLAMLAHELRNPLAPIRAAADLLALVSSDAGRVVLTSQIIARQVGHMTELIDDLLDVARVTRGLIVFEREPLDARDLLTEAIEQTGPMTTSRGHRVVLHLPPVAAPIFGDRKRLIQVIANLVGNAAKYTPDGGDITVSLRVDDKQVVLEISDNGIGMAPEVVSQVFDLFSQAARSPDRSQGGLGLGLALVKSLVSAHDGTVVASSGGPGKGSVFTVRLPKSAAVVNRDAGPDHAEGKVTAVASPLRIMIVDDNIDAASILELFLQATGHEVSVDHAAVTALERARENAPQVCLLDIGLPDMDGHELARELRRMPQTENAILIAITGYSLDRDREKSVAAGFDYHFVKPVDTAKLTQLLSGLAAAR